MTGARRLVADMVPDMIPDGASVIDVGTGDGWLAATLQDRCSVTAIDRTWDRCQPLTCRRVTVDLVTGKHLQQIGRHDIAVAVYCLQHLLDDEATVWRRLRDCAARLIVVGRYLPAGSGREYDRGDPLNGYDSAGLVGLAVATGWRIKTRQLFRYVDDYYESSTRNAANAFVVDCEPWA